MEQDPKQKDTNTRKDTAKGHAGLLPKPRPGGAFMRPAGTDMPRKFGVGKGQVNLSNTLPADILAAGGW